MNSNLRMRRNAGIITPTFYEYVKGAEVKVASKQTLTEGYWEAINPDDKGTYNGEKCVLIVEMGLLKIAPVQVLDMMSMSDFKSKEKSKTDGAPEKVELKHLSDTPSVKDDKVADTEAKSPESVKVPTELTNMKSSEKSKTDGAPKKTELVTKPEDTSKDGGDPVKTAETVIKDVKSGNRKITTDGVVKEDLEDVEDEDEDEPEVKCKECGGTFQGKDVKTVDSCAQHKGMSPVEGDDAEDMEDEEAMQESVRILEALKHTKNHTIHDDYDEWKVHNDMAAADHLKDPEYSDAGEDDHMVTHAHIKHGKNKLLVGTWDHKMGKGITFHADEKTKPVKESAEEVAKRLIKSIKDGKRLTDTSEVETDSNSDGGKYKSKLADYMPKAGKVAGNEAKKPVEVKSPTTLSNMKSSEKSKTDGAPKKTELKSDTPSQVEGSAKKKSELAEEIIADHEKRYVTSGPNGEGKQLGYVHSDKYGADKDKRWHAWSSTGKKQGYLDGVHGSAKDAANALRTHHGVTEAWDNDYETPKSKRGMWDGWSQADLESELAKLKKSGPHAEGSAEYTREHQLEFALRAKSGWGKVKEAWSNDYETPKSRRGLFDGKSKEELESELAKLKKSGPHKEGSPEFTKEKEVSFALRAKSGWGKVEEAKHPNEDDNMHGRAPPCAKCGQHRDAGIHIKEREYKGYHKYEEPKKDVKESVKADAVEKDEDNMITHKGVHYFKTKEHAHKYATKHGYPTDRISEYKKGHVIQGGVSGDYAGPHGLKIGDWPNGKLKPMQESAVDVAKKIIAQVLSKHPPHEAKNSPDAKDTKNNGFDYNKLIDKDTQVDATRRNDKEESDIIANKRGEKYLNSKLSTPKKVIEQINQRIKELEDSKEAYGDYSGSDGKKNCIEFLKNVKELLSDGSLDGFQQAQIALTSLATQIQSLVPSSLINFLATGRNNFKDNGSKPEEV